MAYYKHLRSTGEWVFVGPSPVAACMPLVAAGDEEEAAAAPAAPAGAPRPAAPAQRAA